MSDQRRIARCIATRFRWPWHRDYVRSKLRLDPAFSAVADRIATSSVGVLDIGCGFGLLGFYLRECGFHGNYRGIDFDQRKIAEARRITREYGIDLAFDVGEANSLPQFSGHVVLLDVLHYLDAADQQSLLREAAARVAPGALLIVRNVLRERGWRFHITVWEERIAHALRWMRSPPRYFPERTDVEAPLRAAGLDLDIRPLWGSTPFNSYAIVARRNP